MRQFSVVVVGGGTGGIAVAARLARRLKRQSIAVIEPSLVHYYQPMWTLVGAGVVKRESTVRTTLEMIPKGVEWIRQKVTHFTPAENSLRLDSGESIQYQSLVLAPGLKVMWDAVNGLREAIDQGVACSNYTYETVQGTWEQIQKFRGGRAIFTYPNTPIKCGGAPQKIAYLAAHYWQGLIKAGKAQVEYVSALPSIFAIPKYAAALEKVLVRRKIRARYRTHLVAVDAQKKIATFENLDTRERTEESFDFLHVTPPMGPTDFIRTSAIAGPDGWVPVHPESLQHVTYSNIFCVGDASNLPTSKTGAAIRKQTPVVVENLLAERRGETLKARYDGYTSCPLVTGYGRLILAEFGYGGVLKETFPFDQARERRSMYWLKRFGLPILYWRGMMRGRI